MPLFLYLCERRKNIEEHGASVVNSLQAFYEDGRMPVPPPLKMMNVWGVQLSTNYGRLLRILACNNCRIGKETPIQEYTHCKRGPPPGTEEYPIHKKNT